MIERVYLVGMMGAGKTTVAKKLAGALGWDFVDTDEMAEQIAGKSIKDIFAQKGEAYFREIEKQCVARTSGMKNTVIAVGGGAVLSGDNWRVMQEEGALSVYLKASIHTLTRHTKGSGERPLLPGDPKRLGNMLRSRKPFYQRAKATVEVDGKTPGQVAALIAWLMPREAPDHQESPVVGPGLSAQLHQLLKDRGMETRSFLITERGLWRIYGQHLSQGLKAWGSFTAHMLPGGEASKSVDQAVEAWRSLASMRANRFTPVIAVGGGVVGDLAGFVASTYMRGIPLFNVPTSLLAMVDSALGGKNALNLGKVKNLVGTFYNPELVICDPVFLLGLDPSSYSDGWAEIIKVALVADPELWELLQSISQQAADRHLETLTRIVRMAGAAKLRVVNQDPTDRGWRHVLNFGHTVGHAIELQKGISHGKAVAMGMVAEARFGARKGITPEPLISQLQEILERFGLPADLPDDIDLDKMNQLIDLDKKRRPSGVVIPVVEGPGQTQLVQVQDNQDIIKALS